MFEVDGINIFLYKDAELTEDTLRIEPARHASDLGDKEFDVHGLKLE